MIKFIEKILKRVIRKIIHPLVQLHEKNLLNTARLLAYQNNNRQKLQNLSDVEFSVFSQWGEDGIISWIIDKIDEVPTRFIEFGVENYSESNTRFLLMDRNWSGLIFDGSEDNIKQIQQANYNWRFDLTSQAQFISAENINELISQNIEDLDVGLLSIDIDGNDFWVWEAITCIKPVIVAVEYNALLGDKQSITVPYDPDFVRSTKHFSHVYFGASIQALCQLAKQKGYEFVGTNSNGVNAFFIRSDKAEFILKNISEVAAFPSKLREGRDIDGLLSLDCGLNRIKPILDCKFIDLEDPQNNLRSLRSFESLYSNEWLSGTKSQC